MGKNLTLYNKVRAVPKEAQKTIGAGRLKGMTDINPMWRIKTLTEQFGMCGIGWKAPIKRVWTENGANGEITANVEIELFYRTEDGQWSDGICGIGGSKLVAKETSGMFTDDECYKKAYTDAISVACKALGMGADVYWQSDRTKYDQKQNSRETNFATKEQVDEMRALGVNETNACKRFNVSYIEELTEEQAEFIISAKKGARQ